MIIGPDNILRCSTCSALMRQRTYRSFNTFLGRLWSDGFFGDPGSTFDPEWCICHGCGTGLCISELEVVGKGPDEYALHLARCDRDRALRTVRSAMSDRSIFMRFKRWIGKALSIEELKEFEAELEAEVITTDPNAFPGSDELPQIARLAPSDYAHLLVHGAHGTDDEKEIDLRVEYWWTMNHPVRKDPELRPSPLTAHHANLKRQEELLLARGEPDVRIVALRMELGRFEEAGHYLSTLPEREETKEQRDAFDTAIAQRVDRVFRIA